MHASTLPQLFDPTFGAADKIRPPSRAFRARLSSPIQRQQPLLVGEGLISITKLYERLTLLARLELPCTIRIASPALLMQQAVIDKVELGGDSLTIVGKDFNLRLLGPNIHSIRLVNQRDAENGITRLDIHHSQGMLYASIQPTPDGTGNAVWQDVMDNPTLSLA